MIIDDRKEHEIIYTFMKLNEEFPELSKIIKSIEQKSTDENSEKIALRKLVPYFESLDQLVKEFRATDKGSRLGDLVKFKLDGYPFSPLTDDIYDEIKKEMEQSPNDLSENETK